MDTTSVKLCNYDGEEVIYYDISSIILKNENDEDIEFVYNGKFVD